METGPLDFSLSKKLTFDYDYVQLISLVKHGFSQTTLGSSNQGGCILRLYKSGPKLRETKAFGIVKAESNQGIYFGLNHIDVVLLDIYYPLIESCLSQVEPLWAEKLFLHVFNAIAFT